MELTEAEVWELLDEVKDPEIPVVSVVEMGIIREVAVDGSAVRVTMTPTFSGCPALATMRAEIRSRLASAGADPVEVVTSNAQPWTSEWIQPEAREKLRKFGLAPPPRHSGDFAVALLDAVPCPFCSSTDTTLKNSFGSTLCRLIFYCNNCQQPFEQFKPV